MTQKSQRTLRSQSDTLSSPSISRTVTLHSLARSRSLLSAVSRTLRPSLVSGLLCGYSAETLCASPSLRSAARGGNTHSTLQRKLRAALAASRGRGHGFLLASHIQFCSQPHTRASRSTSQRPPPPNRLGCVAVLVRRPTCCTKRVRSGADGQVQLTQESARASVRACAGSHAAAPTERRRRLARASGA